jgi:glycosyltransferase involved in cell wall biosynthesis
MVLLIGNYAPDRQQSMLRFNTMMLEGLTAAGIAAQLVRPTPFFGNFRAAGGFIAKWLAYLDKYLVFPRQLKTQLRRARPSLVHILDHSNAVYASDVKPWPLLITCHDLLAVRGGLGEDTDCPASTTGKFLQRWILRGLQKADALVCISQATCDDAERLLQKDEPRPSTRVLLLGLNYPYRVVAKEEARDRLAAFHRLDLSKPFVLHVGSALKRKNRDGVLKIFARTKEQWNGQLVFAGDPLTPEMHSLGRELGISDRVVEIVLPDSYVLEALYNLAAALVFPSRYEGFGWPIAEAEACGCPVVCSDHPPMSEAAGDAGLMHAVNDEEGFARDILRLTNEEERAEWSRKSLRAAARFAPEKMIAQYVEIYRTLAPQL